MSSALNTELVVVVLVVFVAADAGITVALRSFVAGVTISGCVFVICTAGEGRAAGLGKMLMRAVSFFGPACVRAPG